MINFDADSHSDQPPIPPYHLAHFVLQTSNLRRLVGWYQTVLGARIVFENDSLAFLTYDDEHHRIAIAALPGLKPAQEGYAGVHHNAFTYRTYADLMATYERLAECQIEPILCINHGPTTSLYYSDPDGNKIELQVDNFETSEEATNFFNSPQFAENPIGVQIDPNVIIDLLRQGEDQVSLMRRSRSGERNFLH